ncbi:phage tail spike protein, partial [Lactococcus lactis subsp. lactis]
MLISIHDHTLKRVGFLSNDDSETPDFKDDNFHRYLAQGTSTFDFTVNKIKNGVVQDYVQLLNERAYFSFQYEGEDFLFDSVIVEEDDDKITFNCLSLNLEMRNEEVKALKNTVSHNIKWYFDQLGLINFAKISLGINQVENYTRTINYDSEDTKLARLISVIQNFDAEFEFVTKLKRDGTLDNITLNIYKKNDGGDVQGVGQNRNDVLLSFGENVTGVNRKVEKSQIFNSLYVTGKDGLSWKNSAWSVTNSEGQEEFYKRAGESYAKAPLSAQMFPSQLQSSSGDIFTNNNESTEYATVNAMWGYALSQLKQYAYPLVTYEVTATSNLTVSSTGDGMPLHIGDTVRIQDKNFIDSDGNVGLFLSARVSELEISFTNPTSNKIMFSNYIKLKSEVSDDLTARMQEIINANTPYRPDITSTNGLQFKNGTGTTILGAHIYFGSDDKEATADSYEWSKDGTVVAPTQTITVDASGVADKAVYSFKATVAGKVVASQSVTITNVDDGTAGSDGRSITNIEQKYRLTTSSSIPTQDWTDSGWLTSQPTTTSTNKYLWSITRTTFNLAPLTQDVIEQKAVYGDKGDKGDTGNDGRAGKDGVGLRSTTVTYTISSSGTVTPTAGWNSQVPTLVKGQYLWTKTVWNYSDGTSESGYTVSYIAKDGNNGHDGIAGKDGTGIKKTTITYAVGTSGTTAPASGWNSQVPNVPAGQYLWTKTVWAYTDKTSETGYSVSKFGEKGDKGDRGIQGIQGNDGSQGIPGPKGADGKTQYTHIAYANSADGKTGFSTSDSNRAYIGMYVDFNINDSTTPSDYSWTLVKGADGTQGTPGKPGTDGKTPYFHTAWSYSADGTDGFTTVYPNLNLLDGTKDFSGNWTNASSWVTDGTYKGLTVKKRTNQWVGIYKTFTAPKDGVYTFSAYVKSSGDTAGIYRLIFKNGVNVLLPNKFLGNNFDWLRDSFSITLEAGDVMHTRYEISGSAPDTILWTAGHKWEEGSTATPHMRSASEVTTADWPSYIGQYTDFTQADSTNPSDYTWSLIRGNDGKDGADGKDGRAGKDGVGIKTTVITYAISTNGTTAPNTGWTSSVPGLIKGQYLWTKTVWSYTDNSSETGYSVTYISKDGNNGHDGIAGKDGVGIKTTTITYAGSTSGTTVPNTGWTSTVPTVAAGSYLWTKTVWAYTDNTIETGYSVGKMGNTGPAGPAGSDGNPGKVVSDTEPTTRFKGLTWKYSGTSDLTASDGTVIKPNTEYYYNGTHWMINFLSANNIDANSITAEKINGTDLEVKNGKFTDGVIETSWKNGTVAGSTNIEKDHLIITRTDSSVNTTNSIGLDSTQGLIMVYTENSTGRTISVGTNFQGMSLTDSTGISASISPAGVKL